MSSAQKKHAAEEKMEKTNYYKNIIVNYIFTFTRNLNVTHGIWMLYLASKGLSLFEIGLLEGVFHVTSMLMETPTGAVADIFGRKTSRIVGTVLAAVSGGVMIISTGFWGFAAGFIVSAISYNFESGANEALVYDSLLVEKKESIYMKIAGRTEVVFQATGIAALIIGGAVGGIKFEWAYYLAIILSVVSLFTGLFFKEPPVQHEVTKAGFFKAMKNQYTGSFHAVKSSGRLLYLILFTSLLCSSVTLTFFYMQLSWENAGLSVLNIGIYLAASSLAAAAGAMLAARLEKKLGEAKILKTAPFIVAAGIALMYFTGWALVPFCVINFVEAVIFVATRDYINKSITSDRRATVLSFESLMFSLVMILTFPLFGYLSDSIGMDISFVLLGGLMLALSFVNLVFRRNAAK